MLELDETTLAINGFNDNGVSEATFLALRDSRVSDALANANLEDLAAILSQDKKNLEILKRQRASLEASLSNILRLQQYCEVLPP